MMAHLLLFFWPCCVRGSEGRAVKGEYRMGAGVGWVLMFRAWLWSVPGVAAAGLGCLQAADEGVEAGGEPFVAVV